MVHRGRGLLDIFSTSLLLLQLGGVDHGTVAQ